MRRFTIGGELFYAPEVGANYQFSFFLETVAMSTKEKLYGTLIGSILVSITRSTAIPPIVATVVVVVSVAFDVVVLASRDYFIDYCCTIVWGILLVTIVDCFSSFIYDNNHVWYLQ